MIVQELRAIQDRCGYLPEPELRALARRTGEPLHRLHEVASCFPLYRLQPPPRVAVRVCRDMACHLRGARALAQDLAALAAEIGGGQVVVEGVSCLGQCDHAPAVALSSRHGEPPAYQEQIFRGLKVGELRQRIRAALDGEAVPAQHADRTPLAWKIDPYQGQPRYDLVRRFVADRDADAVLAALQAAGLQGMGGAAFPTHLKWRAVRDQPGPAKYVVCNADESEPGTFKDRELLRRAPHLVIEGMVLAGLVVGAVRAYLYVRHEFEEEIEAVQAALDAARAERICGENILGSELTLPVEIFVSPGGYICGEESALLEAIEDRRAEPRNKPPFPVQVGLFGKPTVINNVETLSWVPAILLKGGPWYRDQGVRGGKGLRFVSVCGDVHRPGVFEVPFGQTVRELIEMAGGMRGGQPLKAIAPSGPSSGYLPAVVRLENIPEKFRSRLRAGAAEFDVLDLPLANEPRVNQPVADLGSMLGAAFVVVGERTCMVDMVRNTTEFFRNESCGKCVPCRVGSQKLVEMLTDIVSGRFAPDRLPVVDELARTMRDTSICGLGMVAANPMASLITHFREELDQHVLHRRCPLGVCAMA